MELYLCEKPSQARDLARILKANSRERGYYFNADVVVTYAVGHLLEMASPETYAEQFGNPWRLDVLPIAPAEWKMVVVDRTRDQYQVVRELLKQADELVIATDADREGEVIAREITERVGYTGRTRRLWVSDSTDSGLRKALGAMRRGDEFKALYASGLGRQRSDWLAGMNLTRALTVSFQRGKGVLPFGRVQTPTAYLVVKRERAINSFVPKAHLTLQSSFSLGAHDAAVPMRWNPPKSLLDKDGHVVDAEQTKAIAARVLGATGSVNKVTKSSERQLAPLLYYLGGIQKEANNRFGISPKDTLAVVQSLYETHKLVTYPRTDCEYISEEMFADVERVLAALKSVDASFAATVTTVENDWKRTNPIVKTHRAFNTAKVAASAHHAIIPTANHDVRMSSLSVNEAKIYDLIRRRYLAQFAGDYTFEKTVVEVSVSEQLFSATGNVPTLLGWKAVFGASESRKKSAGDDEDSEQQIELPPVKEGDSARNTACTVKTQKTQPPKRYTQASLISAMESIDKEIDDPRLAAIMKNKEKAGIGTEATRADILEKLLRTELLALDGKHLVPTQKGNYLIETLEKVCPETLDLALTALWEDQLTQVEQGALPLTEFELAIKSFVERQIALIKESSLRVAISSPVAGAGSGNDADSSNTTGAFACPVCTRPMRQRTGARGVFWGCSGYPTCSTTLPDVNGKPDVRTTQPPKHVASAGEILVIGKACPRCSVGKITTKVGKNGTTYLTCTNYSGGCRVWVPQQQRRAA